MAPFFSRTDMEFEYSLVESFANICQLVLNISDSDVLYNLWRKIIDIIKTPFTRIRIRLYPQTFYCGYAYRPHVSGENAYRNCKLLKTLFRVETFENATNPDTCGRTVTATIWKR